MDPLSDMRIWETHVDPATGRASGEPRFLTSWNGFDINLLDACRDAKSLAFLKTQRQSDVYVGELEDEGRRLRPPRRLTLDERQDQVWEWTRDSRAVLFSSNRNGTPDIFKQGLDQQSPDLLVGGPDSEMIPQLSPDGEWVLYRSRGMSCEGGLPPVRVMRIPATGGGSELVGEVGPCGTSTRFSCPIVAGRPCVLEQIEGSQVLYELDPISGKGRTLLRSDGVGPWAISPDGLRIAWSDSAHPGHIQVLDLMSGERQDIVVKTPGLVFEGLAWSADAGGFFVAAYSPQQRSLQQVDQSGNASVLWEGTASLTPLGPFRLSPDGRYLAFTAQAAHTNAWLLEGF